MDGTTGVWLGLTLAAPLTLVPHVALVRLLHSRRAHWQPLDVLLVALVAAQLCCTLASLSLSAAALARHAGLPFLGHDDDGDDSTNVHESPLCAALVSFWAAAHTLHAATLASMAVDRAMTVRWPYKYRVSVRRTQVRYHVVVLAVVSVLVGVATLFASSGAHSAVTVVPTPTPTPNEAAHENLTEPATAERQMMPAHLESCTFLPYLFDARFSLFWICLHGLLLIATLSAGAVVMATKIALACCSGDLVGLAAGSGSDMRTLGHASDGSSATLPLPGLPATGSTTRYSTAVSPMAAAAAARGAKPMFNANDAKGFVMIEEQKCCWNKQRHSTVAAVLIVAYATYHLPLLALTTLGTFFVHVLPSEWPYSPMVLASSLGSSLLVMAVLVIVDPSVHAWMLESLAPSRRHRRHRRHRLAPLGLGTQRSPATSESATLEQTPSKIDDEYRISQIYSAETPEAKFPLTNGSLFVHLMNASDATGARANRRPSRMGVSAYDQRHQRASNATTLASSTHGSMYLDGSKPPPLLTFMSRSKILSLNSLEKPEPLYNDPGEADDDVFGAPDRCTDEAMNAVLVSSLTGQQHSREPIYASLSETISSCNTLDSLGARILGEALERDEAASKKVAQVDSEEDSDSSDAAESATESAGDDFEFHNIRTSRQTLVPASDEEPVQQQQRARSRIARSATYRVLCNGLDVKCAKRDDTVPKVIAASESRHGLVTCVTIKADDENLERNCSLRKSKLLTSLSMNDIDIIGADQEDDEENHHHRNRDLARSDSLFSLDRSPAPPPEGQSELELSRLPLDGRRPRKPGRPSIQQHLEHLERHRHRHHQFDHVHLRKKSSRRAAALRRFHDRVQQRESSANNGTPVKSSSAVVVSIAALKAALSHSSASYLDNGDVYPSASSHHSRTVFVSEYI